MITTPTTPGHAATRRKITESAPEWLPCCSARDLALATLNTKDYADLAEHEGLQLVL
jgi:hypothetical protein